MKRDLEIVRAVLLRCEELPAGELITHQHFASATVDPAVTAEHVALMIEAELLDGKIHNIHDGPPAFIIARITWKGHDFIAAARDNTLWQKLLTTAKNKAAALTIDTALAWLKAEAARRIGVSLP